MAGEAEEPGEHAAPVGREQRQQRHLGRAGRLLLHRRGVFGGLFELGADVDRDEEQHDRGEERQSPPDRHEGLLGHAGGGEEEGRGGKHDARRWGAQHQRGEEAAPVDGHVFGDHRRRVRELGPGSEALQEPEDHEQDRGEHADGGCGGQQADGHGGDRHEHDREDHRRAAAVPVADVTDDDAADRPGEEADGEGRQGRELACPGDRVGEEQRADDQACGGTVEGVVIPFDDGADDGGDDGAAGGRAQQSIGSRPVCG